MKSGPIFIFVSVKHNNYIFISSDCLGYSFTEVWNNFHCILLSFSRSSRLTNHKKAPFYQDQLRYLSPFEIYTWLSFQTIHPQQFSWYANFKPFCIGNIPWWKISPKVIHHILCQWSNLLFLCWNVSHIPNRLCTI